MAHNYDTNSELPRTAKLLNNNTFSDILLYAQNSNEKIEKFYAHKLILALGSKVFAQAFYERSKPIAKIKVPAPASAVFHMLQFLYTNRIELKNVDEAWSIYNVAKRYGIEDLKKMCENYILKEEITIDNIFSKYDYAVRNNFNSLLYVCRKFVCINTKAVFQSFSFVDARSIVIEDIIKQDFLMVDNEMEIIGSVLKWSEKECERRGLPNKDFCKRNCITPFLKYLRFLTLTVQEFCEFVDKNLIFTDYESSVLTRKLLTPDDSSIHIPAEFCGITKRRSALTYNSEKKIVDSDAASCSVKSLLPDVTSSNGVNVQQSINNLHKTTKVSDVSPQVNTVVKRSFANGYASKTNYLPIQHSSPYIMQNHQKKLIFDLPLETMEKKLNCAFENDIICTAHIKMVRGDINIYGIELFIENQKNDGNELEVFLSLSDLGDKSLNQAYEKTLKNDTFEMIFPQPELVKQNSEVKIEVTIESLKLNRCKFCPNKNRKLELNHGVDFMSEIYLNSNQGRDEGFIFLISKIIYNPC